MNLERRDVLHLIKYRMAIVKTQNVTYGQGLVEYALLLGLVAIVSIAGLYLLSRNLTQNMEPIPELADGTNIELTEESPCNDPKNLPGTNLIENGGFEKPSLRNRSWRLFRQIDGWTATQLIEIQNNVAGSPNTGVAFTELDTTRSTTISQAINTMANCTYTLEFAFSARPRTKETDNVLIIKWNGKVVDTLVKKSTSQTNWQTYVYELTANSGESTLEFQDGGVPNGVGTYLDTVSLFLNS